MKLQIILILTVVLSGCTKWCETPVLLTKREHYLGNNLRLEGIYYSKNNGFYLYRNGVVKDACTNFSDQLPAKYSCGNSTELELASRKDRSVWGVYVVRQDTILVENWGMVNDCDYKTFFYINISAKISG